MRLGRRPEKRLLWRLPHFISRASRKGYMSEPSDFISISTHDLPEDERDLTEEENNEFQDRIRVECERACALCAFWEEIEFPRVSKHGRIIWEGECKRFPPRCFPVVVNEYDVKNIRPTTEWDDWCGEFVDCWLDYVPRRRDTSR